MQTDQQRPPDVNDLEQNKPATRRILWIIGAIIVLVLLLTLGFSWYQTNAASNNGTQATPTPESTMPAQGGGSQSGQDGGVSSTVTPASGVAPTAPVATPTHAPTPTMAVPIPTPARPTQPPSTPVPPPTPAQPTSPGMQATPTP
ncbi:hypothetical protein KSF_053460 [Reticulibacter mediterranei]|uniref:Uncharacterized protein n=1 Tax=Reticulibacter mediterranei TaxID=2778369 RepID=A0A8J3IK76_9CHLR|nr:hypothetical protein [Reticulibacter mediterranei]GHO95298.1 hypothetical protein KSF_053460 [Reticulibacter mediterranei]